MTVKQLKDFLEGLPDDKKISIYQTDYIDIKYIDNNNDEVFIKI